MRADFRRSLLVPVCTSCPIQWAVTAKYGSRVSLDQMSAVNDISPIACYKNQWCRIECQRRRTYAKKQSTDQKFSFQRVEGSVEGLEDKFVHFHAVRDIGVLHVPGAAIEEEFTKLRGFDLIDRLHSGSDVRMGPGRWWQDTYQIICDKITNNVILKRINVEWWKIRPEDWLLLRKNTHW